MYNYEYHLYLGLYLINFYIHYIASNIMNNNIQLCHYIDII